MKFSVSGKMFVAAAAVAATLIAIGAIFLLASSGPSTAQSAGQPLLAASSPSTGSAPANLGAVQPVNVPAPVTTTTTAVAPGPDAHDVPTIGAGKPASFWTLTLAYPKYCTLGSTVTPVLTWNAADTSTVAVSVDAPTTVGGYGFFGSVNTLTMPSIACTGTKGNPLPTHEYELDAFGTDKQILHVIEKVAITVSPNLTYPVPGPITATLPVGKAAV